MNNKWIQRRKYRILKSSGWATIWETQKKNLHILAMQWAAVNSEFRPLSSRFEAPSFTEWLPGSWVNFPYHLGMIPECASTLVLPQNTLGFPPFSSWNSVVHCLRKIENGVKRGEEKKMRERRENDLLCGIWFWLCILYQIQMNFIWN